MMTAELSKPVGSRCPAPLSDFKTALKRFQLIAGSIHGSLVHL